MLIDNHGLVQELIVLWGLKNWLCNLCWRCYDCCDTI